MDFDFDDESLDFESLDFESLDFDELSELDESVEELDELEDPDSVVVEEPRLSFL